MATDTDDYYVLEAGATMVLNDDDTTHYYGGAGFGSGSTKTYHYRARGFYNNKSVNYFIPWKTLAERNAVINNFGGNTGCIVRNGNFVYDGDLYGIFASTGACWSGYSTRPISDIQTDITQYATPTYWEDVGVYTSTAYTGPYTSSTVEPTNAKWLAYERLAYVCPSSYPICAAEAKTFKFIGGG